MYKNVLESISGVEIYPLISLVIFFVFFSLVLIWVFKADKQYMKKMETIPFDNNDSMNGGIN